jgi:hypothetical protein
MCASWLGGGNDADSLADGEDAIRFGWPIAAAASASAFEPLAFWACFIVQIVQKAAATPAVRSEEAGEQCLGQFDDGFAFQIPSAEKAARHGEGRFGFGEHEE